LQKQTYFNQETYLKAVEGFVDDYGASSVCVSKSSSHADLTYLHRDSGLCTSAGAWNFASTIT
jgi:hypothetical protein